ncbi:MAG: 3-dehydroquinate synthase [Undibacterium sp.]|uniref:AroB-related putative sugar phosphate phospholyase (cyclizing) n=1 Tax=Undibacterium sp. TaxID=1914977 RepID=UPI00271E31E5|nr:AroB-related putative sugar phosphate phospholyase (cyclizing) [Undibacterium sp.]MDO8652916.1 3-dehydroquinate synthase [Undibacterium sp.]
MFEELVIQSHKGAYTVIFDGETLPNVTGLVEGVPHFLIDANVARLYAAELADVLAHPNCITIEAVESNKSLEKIIPIIEQLVQNKVRRDHTLVAIGGGIIQDITCFIASTLLRGVPWRFVPTTLLSQADSCIGSKSSINLGDTKNILGTFNPPEKIYLCSAFLDTLDMKDIRSGIGEIIKVHAIDGADSFDRLALDFDRLTIDRELLLKYIQSALLIKQRFIEEDEFDRGIRNIFNYGHSFGHAIESATRYTVPHGIAVTIGMDMANFIAVERGFLPAEHFARMHGVLHRNYEQYADASIDIDVLIAALMKDKKNTSTTLGLIFPVGNRAEIQRVQVPPDDVFRSQCVDFLTRLAA